MAEQIVRELVDGEWVTRRESESAGGGLPAGGTTGEVLAKQSDADGDVGWDPSGGSQPGIRAFPVTMADILAAPGTDAAAGGSGAAGEVLYEAVDAGIAGNAIAVIADVQPSVGALTVEVDGTTITLHLKTDGDSVVLSQANEVRTAVNADPAASALVTATSSSNAAYSLGDVFLAGGASAVALADLGNGDVIVGAQPFIPTAFDEAITLRPLLDEQQLFEEDLDATAADVVNGELAYAPIFAPVSQFRCTGAVAFTLSATCEAGAVPSEGELLLLVDLRTAA